MQGNSIEEKTSNIITWFMHNEVKEKPKSNPSSKSKQKRGKIISTGNQKTFSIESTQETKVTYRVWVAELECVWDMMIKEI